MIAKAEAPEAKRTLVWRVLLLNFQFLDFDELAAVHAGRIRAYLEPRDVSWNVPFFATLPWRSVAQCRLCRVASRYW